MAQSAGRLEGSVPQSQPSPVATSTTPLPHASRDWQSALQPSPERVFPSSHTSAPSVTPLPHISTKQLGPQPSPATVFPSSHSSPVARSTTLSPQEGGVQSVRQASGTTSAFAGPSSQSSLASVTPSPQWAKAQLVRQASATVSLFALPLSHSSNSSISPSPHWDRALLLSRLAFELPLVFPWPSSSPHPTPGAAAKTTVQKSVRIVYRMILLEQLLCRLMPGTDYSKPRR